MIQVPLNEAIDQLPTLLQKASSDDVILTSDGQPIGAIIAFADEDDWFDFQLERDPRFAQRIALARSQAATGKTTKIGDLAD